MQDKHYQYDTSGIYRTGTTQPPKSHRGLIAVLLTLVILLGGIASIMSIVNFRLLKRLGAAMENTVPISIHQSSDSTVSPESPVPIDAESSSLGITGEPISPLYQFYYQLPPGLLITHVEEGSAAHRAGIRQNDILLVIDSEEVTDSERLNAVLSGLTPGETVQIQIYRMSKQHSGKQLTFTVTVDNN